MQSRFLESSWGIHQKSQFESRPKAKEKKVTSQHITFEVEEEGKPKLVSRSSVFDRLRTSAPRESVFNRLRISLPTKEGTLCTRRSAFDRLGSMSSSIDTPRPKEGKSGLKEKWHRSLQSYPFVHET